MKKIILILLAAFSFTLGTAQKVLTRPNPPTLVTDAAGVLSAGQVATLEHKLVALDDSTSNQIAVVIIKSLGGDYAIEDYATKLFREWGIGNKKTNNGVLLLVSIDDRKVRIETGYGLEGAIPDITSSEIIHNEIAPEFKKGDYYQGIDNAVNALSKAAAGEYKSPRPQKQPEDGSSGKTGAGSIFGFLILLFIVIMIVRGGRGGGSGGGGLGSIANAVLLSSLLGGGRSGGGGGWGGGGGGGGFGGFGGGSSGGGGASGSW